MSLVSIVMPNYNCDKYLHDTIESVISQTYSNWELLIVDDCSTDSSVEIINHYCAIDKRIKCFINKKNAGPAECRNIAINNAEGKWIAFLDSDDLWLPQKLEKQISFMENNNYHFSYSAYEQIDCESRSLGKIVSGPKIISKRKMFRYNYIGCLTAIYDSDFIGKINISPELKKRNDYAIWLKISRFANCCFYNEVLAKYRVRTGSVSHSKFGDNLKSQYKLFRISEKMGSFRSFYHVAINMIFGLFKKIIYVKKV